MTGHACGECRHWQRLAGARRCLKFLELTGRMGPMVSVTYPACKYYEFAAIRRAGGIERASPQTKQTTRN
jgi:hypothetical protein